MRKLVLTAIACALLTTSAYAGPRSRIDANGMSVIPHPVGCPARLFCACGLAHLWHVEHKPGINKVSNWKHLFPHTSGPGYGVAAVRIGGYHDHVLGIVGGRPGAWEVVDYNSGHGQSHRYTASEFPGFTFVQVL